MHHQQALRVKARQAAPWSCTGRGHLLQVAAAQRFPAPEAHGRGTGTPLGFPFHFGSPPPAPSMLTTQQGAFKATGKTVVITGASQGIGRATALLFARKGYNVVVAARDGQKLQYVADDCAQAAGRQGASLAVVTDVTRERDVRNLVNAVLAKYESVDAVISNAGVFAKGAFRDTPVQEARRLMETNYLGAYTVMQSFLPILVAQAKRRSGSSADRPSLINIGSFAGKVPLKNMAAFTASKFALAGLTQAVRAEVEPLGVHVGIVSPGFVKTNAMSQAEFYGPDSGDERRAFSQMMRALPLTQSSQEVADAILNAVMTKQNEVVVGLPFAAAAEAFRMTGLNLSSMPFT